VIKEEYYTDTSIRGKSQGLLESLLPFQARHSSQVLNQAKCALLVLDMQLFFLEESSHAFVPSGPAILPGIQRLVNVFEEKKRPVFFTRHLNSPTDAGLMSSWWQDLILETAPASRIIPQLDSPKRVVICKGQYDAFYKTDLESMLHSAGVTQVVITGVMTHLCCETTARSAFTRGFEVFFTIDGTATYNEQFHRATLLNLSHGFVKAVLVDEIEGKYNEGI
jgi:isochorismate hydrolase